MSAVNVVSAVNVATRAVAWGRAHARALQALAEADAKVIDAALYLRAFHRNGLGFDRFETACDARVAVNERVLRAARHLFEARLRLRKAIFASPAPHTDDSGLTFTIPQRRLLGDR